MLWVVQHDVLVEEISLECAAVLAEPAPCTLGGDACEEMGGPFVEWALVRTCVFCYVREEGVEALREKMEDLLDHVLNRLVMAG